MKKPRCCKNGHVDPQTVMSLALVRYNFSTPEIRLLMRHVLGHAISGRTIKRLARSAGSQLKRGRPPTTPRIHKSDVNDLIETTTAGLDDDGGNVLQFLHQIGVQFGLAPRQYLIFVAKFIRRGKCMMRRCLLCGELFPSLRSGDRHCEYCKAKRGRLLRDESRSILSCS